MKAWFTALSEREQQYVLLAAAFVVFAIAYFGAWLPLNKAQTQLGTSVEVWREAVDRLRPLKGRIAGNSSNPSSARNLSQSLVVIVDTTLRAHNLNSALQRSQPTGNNIRVEFENVAFDDLVRWLGAINQQYALQVLSGSFSQSGNNVVGRISAQLTLGR